MSNGEDITNKLDPPMSRAEAQIQLQNELENMGFRNLTGEAARYKSYIDETLPGGDNYREVVFTWDNAPMLHSVRTHFKKRNQISHALIRNRKLADGKQTLHVDELQSDLHTRGSKDGYMPSRSEQIKMEEELEKLLPDGYYAADGYIFDEFDEIVDRYIKEPDGSPRARINKERSDKFRRILIEGEPHSSERTLGKNFDKFNKIVNKFSDIPNYPFKDDWYAMSIKQLLRNAIDEGADAISVSSSAPIKARYTDEYSKFYETLYDQKIPSAMKKLANKYGGKFEKGNLDEYDIHGSLLNDARKGDADAMYQVLYMYGEKFDQKYGLDDINEILNNLELATETNIIRITPEMKAKILEEGLPSFAFGGPVNRLENLIDINSINIFED